MKATLVFAGSGPIVILISYPSLADPGLLRALKAHGVGKFMPMSFRFETVAARYGGHFQVVLNDARDSDDLRVRDINGDRAFRLFRFPELSPPIMHDEEQHDRVETAAGRTRRPKGPLLGMVPQDSAGPVSIEGAQRPERARRGRAPRRSMVLSMPRITGPAGTKASISNPRSR